MQPSINTKHPALRLLLLAIALTGATTALASVDTTARPGGVYKLKPGMYVEAGSRCEAPANGAIRQYDGRGIATAHSRACRVTVRSHGRERYTVDQSCIDAGAGQGQRALERQQVTVRDALTFSQTIAGRASTYRYCPVYQMPQEMRKAAS